MNQQRQIYDLFLSHNRADKSWVRKLAEQLESETFDGQPGGRPFSVFFDEWDINTGQNVVSRINQGLTASRYIAVIISPEFLDAPWPTFEWTHAVSEDPTNRCGRLIPIFLNDFSTELNRRAELPAPFKALKWIDFRKPSEFRRNFRKLVETLRDQPPARGRARKPIASLPPAAAVPAQLVGSSADPDAVNDIILGNLLPVELFPATVWSAPTEHRFAKDVRDKVEVCSAFELQETRLFTFADLSVEVEPLRDAVDATGLQSHPVGHWLHDPIKWRWCISLLNRCIRNHLSGLPIRRDDKGRYFFLPKNGESREWQNGQDATRTVAANKTNATGTRSFWVHHAAKLSFITLGARLFLCIDPCYIFTEDGRNVLTGKTVGPLSMKWGGKERNAAILRHIVFWARTLAKGKAKIELATGANPVVLSAIPAIAQTTFGVEYDRIGVRSLLNQVEDELTMAAEGIADEVFDDIGDEGKDDAE